MWGLISYSGNYFALEKLSVGCVVPSREAPWACPLDRVGYSNQFRECNITVCPGLGGLKSWMSLFVGASVSTSTLLIYSVDSPTQRTKTVACLLAFLSCPLLLNPNSEFPTQDYSKKNTYSSQQNHFRHIAFKFTQQNVFIFLFPPPLGSPSPNQQHWKQAHKVDKMISDLAWQFYNQKKLLPLLSIKVEKQKLQKYFKTYVSPGYLIQSVYNKCMYGWANEFNKHLLSSYYVPSTALGVGDSVSWWKGQGPAILRHIFP